MKVRLRQTVRSGEAGVLDGVGEPVLLYTKLLCASPRRTMVSLRMEARWLLADKESVEEMLNQVSLSLARPRAVEREPPRRRDAKRKPRPVMATAPRSSGRGHKPWEAWFRLS
jgi:hypothetical protein